MKVVVVGQGYVGLPLAMRGVEAGYDVVGFEIDSDRLVRLQAGCSYVEDVPSEQLNASLGSGRYKPTADPDLLAGFEVAVITVPSPLKDGVPDLTHIEAAGATLATRLRSGCLVVLESTTYPGTTEQFLSRLLEDGSGLKVGEDFFLAYSPERIDPGNRRFCLRNTPKLISGVDGASLRAATEFYRPLVDRVIPVSRPREAELAKLVENTFRHVNVALVNELAMFAAELGVDIWEALEAAATKPFGYMRFNPGPGVGGHCLPIDPSYLSWHVRNTLGRSFRFVELANDVNDQMPQYVVHRLVLALNKRKMPVNGSRILLLGLAYKSNTSDLRESPAVRVAQSLLNLGAIVQYVDDHVSDVDVEAMDDRLVRASFCVEELAGSDAAVVLTDHDSIDYAQVTEHANYVFDTRHRCKAPNVEYL